MAAVACSPASPVSVVDACKFSASALATNDPSTYNASATPTETPFTYYIECTASGQDTLKSQVFSPSASGDFEWFNVVFPAAGSWTVNVNDASDDSTVATTGVTVS